MLSTLPQAIPTGIPIATQRITATPMSPIVAAVSFHCSWASNPQSINAAATKAATFRLRVSHATNAIASTIHNHEISMRKSRTRLRTMTSNGQAMMSSTDSRLTAIHLVACSIQSPKGIFHSSRMALSQIGTRSCAWARMVEGSARTLTGRFPARSRRSTARPVPFPP